MIRLWQVLALTSLLAASGCTSELPEAGSAQATLYLRRCGVCHKPYAPGLLTPKMWEAMVARMAMEMDRRGLELSGEDKSAILEYLARNGAKS